MKVDKKGMADVTYDYYHNEQWQTLEVRKDADADPYEQYVWHPVVSKKSNGQKAL